MDLLHTLLPLMVGIGFLSLALVEGCIPPRVRARAVADALRQR